MYKTLHYKKYYKYFTNITIFYKYYKNNLRLIVQRFLFLLSCRVSSVVSSENPDKVPFRLRQERM